MRIPLNKEICHGCRSKRWFKAEIYERGFEQNWRMDIVACRPESWPDGSAALRIRISNGVPNWCDYYLEQIVSAGIS